MRELQFGDAIWREALSALRGSGVSELSRLRPEFAGLIEELAVDASESPILVCGRSESAGKNPRLFLFLTAAFLARAGVRTLFLDLSPDVRWLENLVGADLKEGLVDHLQYGVALERCTHATELDGLSVLSGGAHFLAGSPLDDPPGLRAALGRLRGAHEAIVLVTAPSAEAVDAAGVTALCDVVLTIEEGEGAKGRLAGSERGVVRLTGDAHSARELARLTRMFLGPLPALFAGAPGEAGEDVPLDEGSARERDELDELDFLRAVQPAPRARSRPRVPGPAMDEPDPAGEDEEGGESVPVGKGAGSRFDRSALLAAAVACVIVLGGLAWAFGRGEPELVPEGVGSPGAGSRGEPVALALREPGEGEAAEDAAAEPAPSDEAESDTLAPTGEVAAEPTGPSAPWSVHVGSYQSRESGRRLVGRISAAGPLSFLVPVNLPSKGVWSRVFVGAFADSSAAREALERLLSGDTVEEGVLRRTPLAFRVSIHPDRAAAEREAEELEGRGVPAYVLGDGPATVWAGAFQSETEAELMRRALERAGRTPSLVPRHRPRNGGTDR
ncbi:MAG: SPOR domain-containing protein [Gemmatimonadota bacterium]|nr:SPOR domain-containing protein [Gemmatimonadota bacterium]